MAIFVLVRGDRSDRLPTSEGWIEAEKIDGSRAYQPDELDDAEFNLVVMLYGRKKLYMRSIDFNLYSTRKEMGEAILQRV